MIDHGKMDITQTRTPQRMSVSVVAGPRKRSAVGLRRRLRWNRANLRGFERYGDLVAGARPSIFREVTFHHQLLAGDTEREAGNAAVVVAGDDLCRIGRTVVRRTW